MPELPEVEVARRAVEEHCVGKKIVKAIIAVDSKVIHGVSPQDFEACLLGKTIVSAHRKGKNMWLQLDSPPFPTFQFGMAGAVYIKGVAMTTYKRAAVKDTDEWPSKYSKFFVELSDGLEFSFTDKRRFAKVRLLDNPRLVPPISELGPDALFEPMTTDEFYSSLRKKNTGIKALLLDQSFISGIGNWMADEVLYQARIHPQQIASNMPEESCNTLLKSINEVTKVALEVDADVNRFPELWLFHLRWGKKPGKLDVQVGADSNQFPSNWIFHDREKKPGKALIDGKKIEFINAGGRTTAYVPELQKIIGNQTTRTASKTSKKNDKINENGNDLDEPEGDAIGDNNEAKQRKRSTNKNMASAKGKMTRSAKDEDVHDNGRDNLKETKDDNGLTKRTTRKKTPAVRKLKESGSESEDFSGEDGTDEDDDDGSQEIVDIKQKRKAMGKTSKKRAQPNQKGKQAKKAK
ncbi:hypothetical protein Leryth_003050 [Lithospermum erythrorhizon]|nr:hypothetical protein Leryth_003050 [Lithospermum erythrorhizon]